MWPLPWRQDGEGHWRLQCGGVLGAQSLCSSLHGAGRGGAGASTAHVTACSPTSPRLTCLDSSSCTVQRQIGTRVARPRSLAPSVGRASGRSPAPAHVQPHQGPGRGSACPCGRPASRRHQGPWTCVLVGTSHLNGPNMRPLVAVPASPLQPEAASAGSLPVPPGPLSWPLPVSGSLMRT